MTMTTNNNNNKKENKQGNKSQVSNVFFRSRSLATVEFVLGLKEAEEENGIGWVAAFCLFVCSDVNMVGIWSLTGGWVDVVDIVCWEGKGDSWLDLWSLSFLLLFQSFPSSLSCEWMPMSKLISFAGG